MMSSLAGKTIVVTRPSGQESGLVEKIQDAGANVLVCPLISIVPCYEKEELHQTLSQLSSYDWIVFTSANGVNLTLEFAREQQQLKQFQNARIACIGKATEAALSQWDLRAALIPEFYQAEGLLEAFQKEPVQGKKFLLLRAKKAREILHEKLLNLGGIVTELAIYDTLENAEGMTRLAEALNKKTIQAITFTSPSTVHSFKAILHRHPGVNIEKIDFASIGPITSAALRQEGYRVTIEAKIYTSEGLFEAIHEYFRKKVVA